MRKELPVEELEKRYGTYARIYRVWTDDGKIEQLHIETVSADYPRYILRREVVCIGSSELFLKGGN